MRSLRPERILTTGAVLIEYLNYFAEKGELLRRKAHGNVEAMLASATVRILPQTPEALRAGLDLYGNRPDKGMSIESMRRESLDAALTNDGHFEQEGFRALFRDPS